MKTQTLIQTIITLVAVLIVVLGGLYVFYPKTPKTESEKKAVILGALDAYNKNDFYTATKNSNRVLRGDDKNVSALLALGSVWAQRGSLEFKEKEYGEKAIAIANRVLDIDPQNAEAYRLIGYANEIQNKFNEAIKSYNKALKFSTDNAEIYNNIGHVYDLMGNTKKAKESYFTSSKLGGDTAGVHMSLGRTYVREKNISKATDEFEKALSLSNNVRVRSEILYTLGNLSIRKGNLDEARKYMEKAVEMDSNFPLAMIGLGKVKFIQTKDMTNSSDVLKNLDESFSHMEKAALFNPNQTLAYLWMGRILSSVGKNSEAREKFNKALIVVEKDITLLGDERKNTKETIVFELGDLPVSGSGMKDKNNTLASNSEGQTQNILELIAPTVHATTFYISDWKEYTKLRYIKSRYAKPGHDVWVNGNTFGCNNGWTWVYSGGGENGGGGGGGGGGSTPPPGGGGNNGGGNVGGGSASQCTNYSAGAWGVCTGYDTQTGQGGTQTRPITTSQGSCPSNSNPASSRSCSLPFSFSLAESTGAGGTGNLSIGSDYEIEAVFVGNSQSQLSSEAIISVSPEFSQYPNMPDINFSVPSSNPALPSGMQYNFSPTLITSGQYSTGVAFSVNVPRVNSGEYIIKVNVNGGGITRVANVKLKVRLLNPTFKEI